MDRASFGWETQLDWCFKRVCSDSDKCHQGMEGQVVKGVLKQSGISCDIELATIDAKNTLS